MNRRGERVVHDEWDAVLVSDTGKTLDVEHMAAGIRDGLAEKALGVRAEGLFDLLVGPVWVDERTRDAHLLHRHAEEVECAAVNRTRSDKMVASFTEVEDCIKIGSLTA